MNVATHLPMSTLLLFVPVLASQADEKVVNTPTVIAALNGTWEFQSRNSTFVQTLRLDGSRCGDWHRAQKTLPTSVTYYVEGGELLVQYYYEPNRAFNYRLKQLRFTYELDADTLRLTDKSGTMTWRRKVDPAVLRARQSTASSPEAGDGQRDAR